MAALPTAASAPTPAEPPAATSSLSWEGDKMFNIYIYDYCSKRGFHKTAHELLVEADIPRDSTPPINARQGLLFEWWSVFWVLFTAKANGSGTEEAMLYTQHQANQAAMRSRPPQQMPGMPQPGGPMGPRPGVNGVGRGFPPNGVMPNGVGGQPPGPTAFAGQPMPNGIMGGPMGQPGFNRGTISGPPRPPNGVPPFQSPTMAHSPPNSGQPQPPMGALHRGPAMLPPGMGQPSSSPYANMPGRPLTPGRTSTPQPMMNHSPSLAPRQPPMAMDLRQAEMAINNELQAMPPGAIGMIKNELGIGEKPMPSLSFQEKQRIIQIHRSRALKPQPNAAAGPSMPPQQRRNKRNSTSPPEDPDDGSSPPNAKKMRTTPDQPMPTGPMYGHPPPNLPQGPPGGPSNANMAMANGMMRQMGGPMGNPMGGPMGNGGFPPGMGQPPMAGGMSMLGMGGMQGGMPSGMSPQMGAGNPMMYRPGMHPGGMPQRLAGGPMNAASPGSDPAFNPAGLPPGQQFAPGNRPLGPPGGPGGPKPMGMLPPPSPAKDQNAVGKDAGKPGSSPRNQPIAGNQPGTGPPTPSSGLMMNQGGPPPSMNAMPPGSGGAPGAQDALFGSDLMPGFGVGGENLDGMDFMFRPSDDLTFDRDFGQWFNNPDDVGGMDLKQ